MRKLVKSVIWIAGLFMAFAIIANIFYYLQPKPKVAKQIITPAKTKDRKSAEIVRAQDAKIKILKEEGLLMEINPKRNEALVDAQIWYALDYQTRQNIGEVMAFYCGRKKGTNANWVDIIDSYSRKKLAKYSEVWGFKEY